MTRCQVLSLGAVSIIYLWNIKCDIKSELTIFAGEELPSDLEMGSDSNSENNQEDEDDGEWNMMGAALEREFLGLED